MPSVMCQESVVVTELSEKNRILFEFVNDSMLVVNAARPVSGQTMFERFRLSYSLERGALNIQNQRIDPFQYFSVGRLTVEVIFPGMFRENQPHPASSRSVPPPDSSSAIDSRSLRAFFGLRRR